MRAGDASGDLPSFYAEADNQGSPLEMTNQENGSQGRMTANDYAQLGIIGMWPARTSTAVGIDAAGWCERYIESVSPTQVLMCDGLEDHGRSPPCASGAELGQALSSANWPSDGCSRDATVGKDGTGMDSASFSLKQGAGVHRPTPGPRQMRPLSMVEGQTTGCKPRIRWRIGVIHP